MTPPTYRDALAAFHANRHDEAAAMLEELIPSQPDDIGIVELLAIVRIRQGRMDEAESLLKRGAELASARPSTFSNLAKLLFSTSRGAEAETWLRRGLERFPDARDLLVGASDYLMSRKRAAEAVPLLRRAVKAEPKNMRLQNNLAAAASEIGDVAVASYALWRCYRLEPNEARLTSYLSMIQRREIRVHDPTLAADIARGLELSGIDPDGLVMPGLSALRADPVVAAWLAAPDLTDTIATHPLLIRFIGAGVIPLADYEQALTVCRRLLLTRQAIENGDFDDRHETFAVALARQGWLNEYVWAESAEEEAALDRLTERIASAGSPSWRDILVRALYRPLGSLGLPDAAWQEAPSDMAILVRDQIEETAALARRREEIPTLVPVADPTSRAVKAQYEENPYPRWTTPNRVSPSTPAEKVRGVLPWTTPAPWLDAPTDVLIAGCGSGRHAVESAIKYSECPVLAIDISRTSLAYASEMAERYRVPNLTFMEADILDLPGLGRTFGVIESAGVLHHMADPLAGWRIMTGLLRRGGIMKIGLYSSIARAPIAAAREFVADAGYRGVPEEIRRSRADLYALDGGHPAAAVTKVSDFFTMSTCRDLLFHVQEQDFTLPQIAAALEDLGLKFLGFEMRHDETLTAYRAHFPEDDPPIDLDNWAAFEARYPKTFMGMYGFWCEKL